MDELQARRLTTAHLEEGMDECRWCFAVDLERAKGQEIARYDFPDGTLLLYACSRCGGTFSTYVPGWDELYVRSAITKLHPELNGNISEELFREVNGRVLYPLNLKD